MNAVERIQKLARKLSPKERDELIEGLSAMRVESELTSFSDRAAELDGGNVELIPGVEVLLGSEADPAVPFSFHPDAHADLVERQAFLSECHPEIVDEWMDDLYQVVSVILKDPLWIRVRPEGYRRMSLIQFPYYFAYTVTEEEVVFLGLGCGCQECLHWNSLDAETLASLMED